MCFFKVTDAITEEITCGNWESALFEKANDFGPRNTKTIDRYQNGVRTVQNNQKSYR